MKKMLINRKGLVLSMLFIASLFLNSSANAQEAKWIWGASDGPENSWRCFRKEINLSAIPSTAVAKIAADSKYWLYINGEVVVFEGSAKRGPNRNGTYFDEVDIKPYLVSGKNTIASLVWYWGTSGFSHRSSGKAGFYFSAQLDGNAVLSDASWKTMEHPAYSKVLTAGPQPNYRLSEKNINYFATDNTIEGWEMKDFQTSSAWVAAIEKGQGGQGVWGELRKNPLPLWLLTDLKAYENDAQLPNAGNGGTIIAKLPYNAQVIAYLKVDAPAGKTIDIRTDAYQDGGVHATNPQYAVRSVYTTKGGVQEFEALAWMSGHEVHYTIPSGVEILELKYRETGYDTEFTGSFNCDDEFYNKLWTKARRTLYVNMRDTYFDCPTRERAQWWGDVVNQLGETFYTFDSKSHLLTKKGIYNLAEYQKPNGVLASPAPGKDRAELPFQMLNSVGWYGFWTYYMNTGDAQTMNDVYPNVKKYLALWTLGNDGLVVKREDGWFWVDWGRNSDYGVLQNCWYYLAQKAAYEMAMLSGNNADAALYSSNMKSIEDNFDKLWDGTAYNSGQFKGPQNKPDDRANAMAILCGLASEDKYPAIKRVLLEQEYASPYMEKYVLEALCVMGEERAALTRMKKRYQDMVDSPLTTLWEFWQTGGMGTYNHGWNAPNTILSQYIAGLAPTEPAWETYQVKPQLGSLNQVQVRVPSVKGNIDVDISKTTDKLHINLISPNNTTALVGVPKKDQQIDEVKVGGQTIWKNNAFVSGVAGVAFDSEDRNHITFKLDPGTWDLVATIIPNPVGPDGYTFYTNEGGTVNVSGTKDIAYGVNGQFVYLFNQTEDVDCTSATFGSDPLPGAVKNCFCRLSADYTPPSGYTLAADQNDNVSISGFMDVAYGANGSFVFLRTQASDLACKDVTFGEDPAPGYTKKCYTKASETGDGPEGFFFIANEKETVNVSGKVDIAYGANGQFNYLYDVTENVVCGNDDFGGDPIKFTVKKCYVRSAQSLGINDIEKNKQIKIYPNPAKQSFTIESLGGPISEVSIYSLSGRLIYQSSQQTSKLSINALFTAGIYFVRTISADSNVVTQKLILE